MGNILTAILVLSVLVLVHELGHFLAARRLGVGVLKFSIGFGPRVWGFRRGLTEYVFSAFPLGGFVKMVGEHDEEPVPAEGAYTASPPAGKRSSTAATTATMAVKARRPSRKACTATSFAALSTAAAVPPRANASRASRRAGKRTSSGARNSSLPSAARSSRSQGSSTRSG